LIRPLPPSAGHTAILVVVDKLSKHAQFVPTDFELKTEGFAHLFVRHVACRFGLPDLIYADRDRQWFSAFWRQVSLQMKVSMKISSAPHPQHDGQKEIVNQQLEWMLRAYIAEDCAEWANWLHLLELEYNSALHVSTHDIPFGLLFSFFPKNYLDSLHPVESRAGPLQATPVDVKRFMEDLQMHRDAARTAVARAQVKQAKAYNVGCRIVTFKEGDLVLVNPHTLHWIESETKGNKGVKLTQRWIRPFAIHKRINEDTYRLRMSDKYADHPVFNIEHLRPYWLSPEEFGPRTSLPETHLHLFKAEEREVDRIVRHKFIRCKGDIWFQVQFQGAPPEEDRWVLLTSLKNAPAILRE
jgi:hypothetical protein